MVKRRSLDDALTPEEEAFLEKGRVESKPKKTPNRKPKEKAPMPSPARKAETPLEAHAPLPQPPLGGGLYSLNTRLAPHLSSALTRASMERKIQRLTPFTVQDIVGEALADWLKRHGFMN